MYLREITDPEAEFREELHSMIHQVTAEELSSRRAPAPVKEGSGESVRMVRLGRTAPGLTAPGLQCSSGLLRSATRHHRV